MPEDNGINKEIIMENDMDYDQLVDYLLEKYGHAQHDYFYNETCRKMHKKVTRTSEGLLCHHIDEDKVGNLSEPSIARKLPFKYQKAERLVYCNYLEHLMLHLNIGKMQYWANHEAFNTPWLANDFIHTGPGFICQDINGFFEKNGDSIPWRNNCYILIKDLFNEYIYILNQFFCYLRNNYSEEYIKIGEQVKHRPFSPKELFACQIESKKYELAFKRIENKELIKIRGYSLNKQINIIKAELSSNWRKQLVDMVYSRLI